MMKLLLSMSFLLLYFVSNAQKKQYNTRIDTAGKVAINGGDIKILKADTVFIVNLIINEAIKTKIYFAGSSRVKDTTGIYTTRYAFEVVSNSNPGSSPFNILISFDKPFIPSLPPPNYLEGNEMSVYTETDAMYTQLHISGIVIGNQLAITIDSKEPIIATIRGVDGRLNQ